MLRKLNILLLTAVFTVPLFAFLQDSTLPAPQSLMVTLTGYRDTNNTLKCKLYYMVTLPNNVDAIQSVRLKLNKPTGDNEVENVADLLIPFDWAGAKAVNEVVSFYTTRNILYIGIGEYDLLRKYECQIAFVNAAGEQSRFAVFKK